MLIGITGHLEAGKTTLANEIQRNTKQKTITTAFANPLKNMCMSYFGFSKESLYTPNGKNVFNNYWEMTPREFMQRLGQGLRDAIRPDVWVKLAETDILKNALKYENIILDDLRMPNECQLIRNLGGVVIRITRPNHEPVYTGIKNHPSEQELPADIIDFEIANDGTIEELYQAFHQQFPNV